MIKLSPVQQRALKSLCLAEEQHGNDSFMEAHGHLGWYVCFGWQDLVHKTTLNALEKRGLVESHPEYFLWRITKAAQKNLPSECMSFVSNALKCEFRMNGLSK